MKNMNECIGLIGGHSGDSLTDKLHELGFMVALVGGRKNEPGMDLADYVLVRDLSNYNQIIDFFLNCNVKKILIGTGHSKALMLSQELTKRGFITNIDYKKSMLAKDKVKFKEALKKINIDTPQFLSYKDKNVEVREIDKFIGIPCVIKSSLDAIQPQKANNYDELCDAIDKVRETNTELLVEEYIRGNDCTVAVRNNGIISETLGVTYYSKAKEYKLKGFEEAYSSRTTPEVEEKICTIAKEIVEKLGFIGLVRVDFIIDQKIYVLELNSVIVTGYHGSAYPFFKEQGIDIPKVMVKNSLEIFDFKEKNLNKQDY